MCGARQTDKGDAICPNSIENGGGIKTCPEPLGQIQNNFIEMFLIKLSIKIAQMVPIL